MLDGTENVSWAIIASQCIPTGESVRMSQGLITRVVEIPGTCKNSERSILYERKGPSIKGKVGRKMKKGSGKV